MLLTYIYGIGVVERDRKNFINEYIENRAVNLNMGILRMIEGVRLFSDGVCLLKADVNRDEIERMFNDYVKSNIYLKRMYLKSDNLILKFNYEEDRPYDREGVIIEDKDIIFNIKKGNCHYVADVNIMEYLKTYIAPETERGVIVFLAGSYIAAPHIEKGVIENLKGKLESHKRLSPSGVFYSDYYVCGFSCIENKDVYVLYLVKRDVFEKAIVSLRYRILMAGVIALFVFLLIGFYISGRITRSMELLKQKSHKIASGEFEKIEITPSNDEIGEAIKAFNKMIDDLRDKEEHLKESQMKLVQAEKMSAFGQLSAGIAHEVKNPLTSVMGYIQLARRIEKDEKVSEYLKIAESETMRCKQILEDLLKFARMDRHQKADVDIRDVLGNTVRLINHQLMMKRIGLSYSVFPEPLVINGNANQLQQVFLNVLLNAMQSIERKCIQDGKIGIESTIENGSVVVSIKDNGEGISKENIHRIFEPFFTTKADSGGTGLGLSISYGIIKEHQGEISVKSTEGEGTEFRIILPRKV
jgi:two-component system NtrC family sensor kinase